jgi:hypothetical protein
LQVLVKNESLRRGAAKSRNARSNTIVSLGRFTGVHGASGKKVDAAYAHIWNVAGGKILRFRHISLRTPSRRRGAKRLRVPERTPPGRLRG